MDLAGAEIVDDSIARDGIDPCRNRGFRLIKGFKFLVYLNKNRRMKILCISTVCDLRINIPFYLVTVLRYAVSSFYV